MPTAWNWRLYSQNSLKSKNATRFLPDCHLHHLSPTTAPGSPLPEAGSRAESDKIVAAEFPFQQPSSLVGFAGCRLTPGWYRSDSRAAIAKRFAYHQSGVPGVGIGNALPDPMLPADKVFSHNEIMRGRLGTSETTA